MIDFLIRHFIKNSQDINNPKVREQYGIFSGITGIICNIILFILKFSAGIITSAISITADAFNNLSDACSSIVTLVGFKMANKPADNDHPYGHGRIEYISGLFIALAIIITGFELFKASFDKIIHPEEIAFSYISVIILVFSIAMKLWLSYFNRKLGRSLNAPSLLATSVDSLSDCIATSAVLISFIVYYFTNVNIDPYAGCIVALFVIYAGFGAAKDTIQPLLGHAADAEFEKAIKNDILSVKQIIAIHDMHIHDYGPGRIIISLHAVIPSELSLIEAHNIIDNIEHMIQEKYNCEITIHIDPSDSKNELTESIKKEVKKIISDIDAALRIHDLRAVNRNSRTDITFDIEVPFDFKYCDKDLELMICEKISKLNEKYHTIINIDKY